MENVPLGAFIGQLKECHPSEISEVVSLHLPSSAWAGFCYFKINDM